MSNSYYDVTRSSSSKSSDIYANSTSTSHAVINSLNYGSTTDLSAASVVYPAIVRSPSYEGFHRYSEEALYHHQRHHAVDEESGGANVSIDVDNYNNSGDNKNKNDKKKKKKPGDGKLRLIPLVAVTFFCVAGGPYGLEALVSSAPPLYVLLALTLFPWVWSFPLSLVCAELATCMPESGGMVVWAQTAFGKFWGYQIGFASSVVAILDNSLYPMLCVGYFERLISGYPEILDFYIQHVKLLRWLVAFVVILFITAINLGGVEIMGWSSVVFTIIIMLPFFVLAGLAYKDYSHARVWLDHHGSVNISDFLSVLIWNNNGWTTVGYLAGSTHNPSRTFPLAMIIAIIVIIANYVFPVALCLLIKPEWARWRKDDLTVIGSMVGGKAMLIALTISAIASNMGLFNSGLATSSKGIAFMATPSKMIPQFMGCTTSWVTEKLNKRRKKSKSNGGDDNDNDDDEQETKSEVKEDNNYNNNDDDSKNNKKKKKKNAEASNKKEDAPGNPIISILFCSACTATLLAISGFLTLVKAEILINTLVIMFVYITFVYMRIREPNRPRPFRVPLPTWLATILTLVPLSVCGFELYSAERLSKYLGLGVIGLGVVTYCIFCFWDLVATIRWFIQWVKTRGRRQQKCKGEQQQEEEGESSKLLIN